MRALKKIISQKQKQFSGARGQREIDEKTIFYITRRVIEEEYGKRGSENIIPTFYKNKKLFLTAHSSLWASEAALTRVRLRGQINKTLGQEVIKEIKVTTQ